MNLYERNLVLERRLRRRRLPAPTTLVAGNSKVAHAFRSLLEFCDCRTPVCTEHCYACKGPISWKLSVTKAVAVRRWIETNGVEAAARRMATEINWNGDFRWMDRGEFDPVTVRLANRLAKLRPDVNYNAFSRKLDALLGLTPRIVRIYSVDRTSAHTLPQVPADIRVAYLKVDPDETIPKRVAVVFPLNHRQRLLGDPRDCSFYRNELFTCSTCRRCF